MALTTAINISYGKTKQQARLIGGEKAQMGNIPYIALITMRRPHTVAFEPLCAGAIITPEHILTTAVCASGCNVTEGCQVFVGRTNVNSGGNEVGIKVTVWHESYIAWLMIRIKIYERYNVIDFGVLHIQKIASSPTASVINLTSRELKDGFPVKVAGWGSDTKAS